MASKASWRAKLLECVMPTPAVLRRFIASSYNLRGVPLAGSRLDGSYSFHRIGPPETAIAAGRGPGQTKSNHVARISHSSLVNSLAQRRFTIRSANNDSAKTNGPP
jgi:hypothetical protein